MNEYVPSLSKSRFIKGLQCHKALWLQTHRPDLQDTVSEARQAVFDIGTSVGLLAQQLFPGGVEVPFDGLTYAEQIAMTREEIAKGTRTIYEATFSHNGVFCKVDILHHGPQGWELHEVKATTRCKDVYRSDIAVQYHIATGSGLPISYAGLVHLARGYGRTEKLEINRLFSLLDLTEDIKGMQTSVAENISLQLLMLSGEEPDIPIGPHCQQPYACNYSGHCRQRMTHL